MSRILSLTSGKCIVICMQFSESDIEMNMNDPTGWHIMWKPDIFYFQFSPVQPQCNRFLSGALIWASYCTKDYHKLFTFSLCFRLFKHILFWDGIRLCPQIKSFSFSYHIFWVQTMTRSKGRKFKSLQLWSLLLHISGSLSALQKTIKVEKYPFPRGGEPAARLLLQAGDHKEVSAFGCSTQCIYPLKATVCLKFRTFAYNEGFGCPFDMTTGLIWQK